VSQSGPGLTQARTSGRRSRGEFFRVSIRRRLEGGGTRHNASQCFVYNT